MHRNFKIYIYLYILVAKRSVLLKREIVRFLREHRSENADMSSVKQFENNCRRKLKVFYL